MAFRFRPLTVNDMREAAWLEGKALHVCSPDESPADAAERLHREGYYTGFPVTVLDCATERMVAVMMLTPRDAEAVAVPLRGKRCTRGRRLVG